MLAQIARMPVATIEKYQNTVGATLYMVRYRKPDNKQTMRRGFRSRRDAQMFAATVEVAKAKGEYVAPKLGRITVGELSAVWLARKSQATKPSHYRMWITPGEWRRCGFSRASVWQRGMVRLPSQQHRR